MHRGGLLFLALTFTALLLGAALAHLYELPHKLRLSRDEYLIVQQIYRGWAMLGVAVVGAIITTAAVVATTRRGTHRFRWSLMALLCLLAAQGVFWTFTYPANAATADWTTLPDGWMALRRQWEYSHAAGAVLTFAAYLALVATALSPAHAEPRMRETPAP